MVKLSGNVKSIMVKHSHSLSTVEAETKNRQGHVKRSGQAGYGTAVKQAAGLADWAVAVDWSQ
jgi:hypothetical protein